VLDISGWEFLTLGIIAVIIFGPDKLPKFAADAARFMNQARKYVNGAKDELTRELGPEFADVKVSDLTPRGMMKKALGDDDPFEEIRQHGLDVRQNVEQFRDLRKPLQFSNGNGADATKHSEQEPDEARPRKPLPEPPVPTIARSTNGSAPTAELSRTGRALSEGEVPPWDADAT
jgi:sec-independent protein translocase protein TatB